MGAAEATSYNGTKPRKLREAWSVRKRVWTVLASFVTYEGLARWRSGAAERRLNAFYGAPDPIPDATPGTLLRDEVVDAPGVAGTVHRVMYAWKPFTRANLVNGAGLPASTFMVRPHPAGGGIQTPKTALAIRSGNSKDVPRGEPSKTLDR